MRIAVLPFQEVSFHDDKTEWPIVLQSLFTQEITGVEGVGVLESFSLNTTIESSFGSLKPSRDMNLYRKLQAADVAFVVDGTLMKVNEGYKLQSYLTSASNGEFVFARDTTVREERLVPLAVRTLSRQIIEYLQIEVLSLGHKEDLRPWLSPRTQNLEAVIAFIQAYRLSFNGIPGAEKYLLRAIELDSTLIIPRVWLTFSYTRLGRIPEAAKQHQALVKLEHSANPAEQALIRWVDAVVKGDIYLQMRHLRATLDYSDGNNVLLAQLAQAQYTLGDFRGSLETLLPALEQKWAYSPAYLLVAACYDSLGQYAKARSVLEKSLRLEHISPEIYALLSRLEFRMGDTARAQEHELLYFQSSVAAGIKPVQIYLVLARNAIADSLYRIGRLNAQKAMTSDPSNPSVHETLANAMFFLGDLKTASLGYLAALQLDSMLVTSHAMLGTIFARTGERAEALYHYRQYLNKDSTSSRCYSSNLRHNQLERKPTCQPSQRS